MINPSQTYLPISKLLPLILIASGCASPIDYFGNEVNMSQDRILLSKMRKDKNDKDIYNLTFVEKRGNQTKSTIKKREKTLNQYIDLIKSYYGYTEYKIINKRERGIIEPRYYVTIKFN
tara:strand:+ start:140 stop:496 length:357 start_codon:yes stop_codon:yes gene_type:complete